ncbi:NrfD/PsrC family molybdoenzyme membrane anchor subunit [Geotalea uraniireducens]|uniref:Polysulphide reductase, NrfD n=1 Tax=Geotalea uraniireducens (strain Rf4) TaxID=351605 RepID=A5GBH3_GEOUR|nr:NrfD/PsrC family molybdoenzyme membrane anchor subunit [Geotalea uraniireducens]ABQ25070.1 Polysulphide reductase, NrfD [Geotalea uraniireducens Rf4]
MVHGELWTVKELFVYPNEYIYWTIQIVMYPFMTGLVAGAFVLSSLYHVFGVTQLKGIARFSLVFSFALLPVAMLPLMLHLLQPQRGIEVMMTPHFTSAIAAFGIVFSTYGMIVASELWFVYRKHFVETAMELRQLGDRTFSQHLRHLLFSALTLGAMDISEHALEKDEKAVKILAGIGIPVACFLHGYAGFIFGSVKANALWMTPLMPVIFICSAVVSGIALCMLTYIVTMEARKLIAAWKRKQYPELPSPEELKSAEVHVVTMTAKYLIMFLILAITLELLDLIFRGYTAVKSWDILRSVIYGRDFVNIFVIQYGMGNLVPFIIFLLPRLTIKRAVAGTLMVLLGVFMMRWNVVIGGQAFSSSFAGFMHYHLPIWPHDMETFKEGLFGALTVIVTPFILFWFLDKVMPVFKETH